MFTFICLLFFRRISQICFGPRGIYFRCPQHLSGRHQLVYVPRHDCCCPWRWWLKILKFGAHFFSRKQNSFWQKKSLKKWVRNPHVLFVLLYNLLILCTRPFLRIQNWNLQNFFYKPNVIIFFLIWISELEIIVQLCLYTYSFKNYQNRHYFDEIFFSKWYYSMCNPAFPFFCSYNTDYIIVKEFMALIILEKL